VKQRHYNLTLLGHAPVPKEIPFWSKMKLCEPDGVANRISGLRYWYIGTATEVTENSMPPSEAIASNEDCSLGWGGGGQEHKGSGAATGCSMWVHMSALGWHHGTMAQPWAPLHPNEAVPWDEVQNIKSSSAMG
jgi:hypothetical protein